MDNIGVPCKAMHLEFTTQKYEIQHVLNKPFEPQDAPTARTEKNNSEAAITTTVPIDNEPMTFDIGDHEKISDEVLDTAEKITHTDNANTDKQSDAENLCSANDFNETFDDQFEEIVYVLTEEAKTRDSDLLADEDDKQELYDIHVAEHLSVAVENEIQSCMEKETDKIEDPLGKPLFKDSPHSLGVAVLLICCFMIRFHLPDEALSYMLRILVCLLPHGHRLMGTLYHFKTTLGKYTCDMLPTVVYHCNSCYSIVQKNSKNCESCGVSLARQGALAYFLELKLVSQLASLWKKEDFSTLIRTHRFQHFAKNSEGRLFDIYDGNVYRKLFENDGMLSNPNNISFSLNTDGAPMFKSSSVSIWPVYLLINELPIAQRKKRMHSLFYGVWISSKKPQMWSFLKPLFQELKKLESDGHSFTDYTGERFTSKCVLLTCTCDLPARALVYNCNQFNGGHSCWHCLQSGETYKHDTGGISHIFPFVGENPKGPSRTKESVIRDINKVSENVAQNVTKPTVNGHKGKFWFMFLDTFNYIDSCVIDYMHGVCLGVMKTLLTIWFDKKNKDKESSFFTKREAVNKYLHSIKPTMFVSRIPRSLDDLVHWKSSEYRNFILYWGVPILRHVLDPGNFTHFCLFARAIFLLSKEGITADELETADTALVLFVEHMKTFYGDKYLTLNVHHLLHLADCVRNTGPLYVNNCFIFEDLNGYIVKQIHGTQGIDTQITNIISMLKVPSTLYTLYLNDTSDGEIEEIYNELSDSVVTRYKNLAEIEDGVRPLGQAKMKELDEEERTNVSTLGIKNETVKEYLRVNMYKKGFYVYGKSYTRLEKRQQCVVTYFKGNMEAEFGTVHSFIQSEEKHPERIINLAVIRPFKKVQALACIWEVVEDTKVEFIPIQNILNVNNLVRIDETEYICPSPNRYDRD